jgi:hypothetical protein
MANETADGTDATVAANPTAGIAKRNTSGVPAPAAPVAAPAAKTPSGGGGGGGTGGGGAGSTAAPAAAPGSTWQNDVGMMGTAMPGGGWSAWKDVPTGEANALASQVDLFENSIGYQVPITTAQMLSMANAGVETQHDLGQYVANNLGAQFSNVLSTMPWAQYGLDKDTYTSMATTFGTEYTKVTGQNITADALKQAFANPRDPTGGLLDASQYAQQLMNDVNIQNTYGWVKYGMDYATWTQTKLGMQTAMGGPISDSSAATVLQYQKAAAGANMSVTAKQTGQQTQAQPAGVGGSVVR